MTKTPCPHCGRDMHPATAAICEHCRHTLEVAVVNIGYYRADLTTLRTGQTHYSRSSGVTSRGDSHLGMDARFAPTSSQDGKIRPGTASSLATESAAVIGSWCRYVLEHVARGYEPTCDKPCLHVSCGRVRKARPPAEAVTSQCAFLLRWADWLRNDVRGREALLELISVERRLARLVDRPPDLWFAGMCSADDGRDGKCQQNLYAKAERGDVKCEACGVVWAVEARRAFMLAEAEGFLMTPVEAARAITTLGQYEGTSSQLTGRIYKWAQRGRILASGHVEIDARMRPLYRLGAILDLLAEDLQHNGKPGKVSGVA